jgi:Tol biopolymer transport system component
MNRQIVQVSVAIMTAVLLAMGIGRALPRGDQLVYSSSTNWQAETWGIYLLDMERNVTQHLLTSRADNMPGFPVVWSPDGGQIAFLSVGKTLETYLVDSQGRNPNRLADGSIEETYNTVWSPDGRHLAFIGEQDGIRDVYVASADGGSPRNLTNRSGSFRSLVWSPDSRKLVLESLAVTDVDIYVLDTETGALTNLTNSPGSDIRPVWSPDGTKIAFMSSRNSGSFGNTRYDLYTVNADGTHLHRYTNLALADTAWEASWSPDGGRIVFGSMSWAGGADIFVIDVPHGLAHNVTRDAARDSSPAWSPDGEQLAFETRKTGHWQIDLVSADGWERRSLTSGEGDSRRPAWSPGGDYVVYIANPGRNWDLYRIDVHSRDTLRMTQGRTIDYAPVWRP